MPVPCARAAAVHGEGKHCFTTKFALASAAPDGDTAAPLSTQRHGNHGTRSKQ